MSQPSGITGKEWTQRCILLVDLDAFFASVEQLDHPEWRGKPLIVGGDAGRRGVVSTASYEARAYGVHSAMPSSQAARLCPDAIWTPGNYPRYIEMSRKVMDILLDESPFLQQVSIDEAFLDVSPGRFNHEDPVAIATRIQERVAELGISCSIGIGVNKTVAKIASDQEKPRGLTVVYPGTEYAFLAPLPLRCMSGIGPRSETRLKDLGLTTLGDVAEADPALLRPIFGVNTKMMQERCRGTERAPIEREADTKSVSNEMSFAQDLSSREDVKAAIEMMADKVGRRLRAKGLAGSTVTLKLRYSDRSIHTSQLTLDRRTDNEAEIQDICLGNLLDDIWQEGMEVRLVGVGVSGFDGQEVPEQLSLFDERNSEPQDYESNRALSNATDKVRDRFGEKAVIYGRNLRMQDQDTGTVAQNKDDYKHPLH